MDVGIRRVPAGVPLLEWTCGVAGASVALLFLVVLGVESLTRAETPPLLAVGITGRRPAGEAVAVTIRVVNLGGTTAAEVGVEGIAAGPDGVPLRSEIRFDFVPRGSQREGALLFPPGTDTSAVRVRALGYRAP